MSYTIPAGTAKAVKAAAFGRELVKACAARDVPLKELRRVTGVGLSSLDNYRTGQVLPKVEVALALAEVLHWPRLGALIVAARTFVCSRSGCLRTFRNDTGAPRRYCAAACQRMAEQQRAASRNLRRAGQTGDGRPREAALRQLRSSVAIADERAAVAEAAIAAMCAGCEPDGLCRTPECPLRPHSPLPIEGHAVRGQPRTHRAIRQEVANRPEVKAARLAGNVRRWASPGAREAQAERSTLAYAARTPEQQADIVAKARAAYPPERRSVVSTRMHAARRAQESIA